MASEKLSVKNTQYAFAEKQNIYTTMSRSNSNILIELQKHQ